MEKQKQIHPFQGHVVVVPYSTLGHTNPMLQFAKNLATRGLLLSFVSLQFDHAKILGAKESLQRLGLHIRLESIPDEIPPHVPIDAHINDFLFYHMHHTMTGYGLQQLLHRLNASPNPVSCIVYDSFLPWVSQAATNLRIPQAFFWTQSAAVFSVYYHFKNVDAWNPALDLRDAVNVPNLPEMTIGDLPSAFNPPAEGDLGERKTVHFFKGLDCIPRASSVLINTFHQLESETLDNMKREIGVPIFSVGPSIPSAFLDRLNPNDTMVGANPWDGADCKTWLDSKPPFSVVYVSFGSITSIDPHQIQELAIGLEKSEHNFFWVIRPPRGHHDMNTLFPQEFLDRTKGRGLVVDWCVQLEVLSHPSVGVFMSHCGWNSTLDSLSLGVPVLAMGIWTDQPTNAKFLADVWKTGLRMRRREDGIVGREEIERCVRLAMEGQEFVEFRKNALKWKEFAKEAMMEDGSSHANLDQFVSMIAARTMETKT